jgi:diguanylate cyclase (GGDEF)-like protein
MVEDSPTITVDQEHRDAAPPGWDEINDELAQLSGLSLLLVEGHQPPALVVSNNNSICRAFQSSPEFAEYCDPYCGDAHRQAMNAGANFEYKCHAGLQCFAQPVQIQGHDNLAVIGGRAFAQSADYRNLMDRIRKGDLRRLDAEDLFSNVIFADRQRLRDLADRVERTARRFQPPQIEEPVIPNEPEVIELEEPEVPELIEIEEMSAELSEVNLPVTPPPQAMSREGDLQMEVDRLRSELEYRNQFTISLQRFLERISSDDPAKTYQSIITNSKDLLQSERASLLVFDESSNELILKAAVGLPTDPSSVSHMRLGEGVSGEVIESGKALMVSDLLSSGLIPAPAERLYKTNSFISYPIIIGGRKIGVLNVTDKTGGGIYDDIDLSLLEIIGPQVALALERAEWQERATEFQLMSITDPLTGLPNRRYLEERLTEELNRSKRYDYPMSFLMIDIDDFKAYNDNNGHQAGDLALQITGHCLKASLRSADVASRYGGEEFCILLPQTSMSEAAAIADRIRQRVATTHFPHGRNQPLGRVTISIGVSTFSKDINSAEMVIAAADRALYRAKSLGKDRIEYYHAETVGASSVNERL